MPSVLAPARRVRSRPTFVVLLFVVASIAWIVVTDEILSRLPVSSSVLTALSIAKGMIYVFVAAYAVHSLLRHKAEQDEMQREHETTVKRVDNLETFIAGAPAALAMFDRELRYLQASDRWCQDYSLDKGILLGKSHYEIFPDLPEAWKEAHRRGLQGDILRSEEDRFVAPGGQEHCLRWEVRPWQSPTGGVGGIIIYTEDITEHIALQRRYLQAQKMEAVGHLASSVGREFNNSLTVILSDAELIASAPDTSQETAQRTNHIIEAARKGARLTSQLLAFSHRQRQDAQPRGLDELIQEFEIGPEFIPEDVERDLGSSRKTDPSRRECLPE